MHSEDLPRSHNVDVRQIHTITALERRMPQGLALNVGVSLCLYRIMFLIFNEIPSISTVDVPLDGIHLLLFSVYVYTYNCQWV